MFRLEVPSSWPLMSDYDESIDYNLTDPKSLDPTDKSLWKEVNCPKEIEFYLRLRNQRHFGQARETPFCQPSMSRKFNWSATTEAAELVLEGNYEDAELTDIQRMFLDNMKRVASEEISSSKYLNADSFTKKMKSWKEKTSTSPSGRHLGHYKTLVSTIDRSLEKGKITDLKLIQTDILKCYVGLINYCVHHRYCLQRWKTIVNMMIYKEPGNVKIHRLRVIHLYEADQSTLWGEKWGKCLRKAVSDKTLNSGQFGGLPGRDCTSITFLEEVRLEYSNLTRFPFSNFDNDASACYDRIVCSIASLSGKKYGVNRDVIFVHAKTLEEAKFKLKTTIGISSSSYTHCVKFPLYGSG